MRVLLAALVLVLGAGPAIAQETGFAVRQTDVKKEPYSDAETVGTLAEKSQVKVLARQGGWAQIDSGTLAGWVRMLSIRMNSGQSGFASGLKSLFSVARTGSSGTTVTTGVRGLDKEQIQNAKPNPEELKKLAGFAASRGEAEKFAAGNPQLNNQKIDYLPQP
ncbi:MAG TPA: SH3 domain-containing protein [Burkholderiales bacterium]|nr:SH3 domain-containing protein [Burkholderiales bacterium]